MVITKKSEYPRETFSVASRPGPVINPVHMTFSGQNQANFEARGLQEVQKTAKTILFNEVHVSMAD
ncbi:MAG: hypothetical protein RLZZ232_2663 [Planctomycetota bacterium]|jgi:hypothetical protein